MREHMRERFGVVNHFVENPPLPASLNIELNNTCNHQCIFCPYHGEMALHKPKAAQLSYEFVVKILDAAYMEGIGKKEVGFYLAGEAFVYKELSQVVRHAKELGFEYTFITTNGALATREKMDDVVNAGLDSIRFSVNAGDKATYEAIHKRDDFDIVLENIKYVKALKDSGHTNIALSLSCVVTKKTMYVIDDVKRVFSNYVDDILFIPIIFSGLKDVEKIKKQFQIVEDSCEIDPNYICPMLFDTMYINAFGKVVPCCEAYHGNVEFYDLNLDIDLCKAWNCESYRRYRNIFVNRDSDNGTICKQCILRRKGVNRLSLDELL